MRNSTARDHSRAAEVHGELAGEQGLLAEAGRVAVPAGRNHQAADAGAHAEAHGRGRTRGEGPRPRRRHRRGARSVLQGRHREGDGGVPAEARRAVRRERLCRLLRAHRRAREDHVSWLHRLQARLRQPGPGAVAGAQHPRELRSAEDGTRERGLPAHRDRGDEARVCGSRHLLRGSGVRAGAGRRVVVEGVREGARGADRSEEGLDHVHRR